jgi:hypothetical protein
VLALQQVVEHAALDEPVRQEFHLSCQCLLAALVGLLTDAHA